MGNERHIIHRVNITIDAPDEKSAKPLQDKALHLFYHRILPDLEGWLDKQLSGAVTIRLDRLDLDLQSLDPSRFDAGFSELALCSFREKIELLMTPIPVKNAENTDVSIPSISAEERLFEFFLFFLETGRRPWWSGNSDDLLKEEMLMELTRCMHQERIDRLIGLFRTEKRAVERLVKQFPRWFVIQITMFLFQGRVKLELEKEEIALLLDNLLMQLSPEERLSFFSASGLPDAVLQKINQDVHDGKSGYSPEEFALPLEYFLKQSSLEERLSFFSASGLPDAVLQKINQDVHDGKSGYSTKEFALLLEYFLKQTSPEERFSLLSASGLQDAVLLRSLCQLVKGSEPVDSKSVKAISAAVHSEAQELKKRSTPPSEKHLGKSKSREGEEDGIYVDHAGLVLLHPFMESFFKEFDLLKDGRFKNERSRNIAIHLLCFLATGEDSPAEHLLTFEKFLCGAELDEPVERFVTVGESMKDECETLLQAAIGHWKALKNTSPDGLREGFLQRSGKLVLDDFQNRLVVENKTHDVLLSFLPWGYGIIKLSWLERPLFVDWFA